MSASPRLLTPEEMAAELRIPRKSLMNAARSGRVPRIEVNAHCIRFDREKVRAALEQPPRRPRRRATARKGKPFDFAAWEARNNAVAAGLPA